MRRTGLLTFLLLVLSVGLLPARAQDGGTCNLDTQEAYVARGNSENNTYDFQNALTDFTCALALNNANLDAIFGQAYDNYQLGNATEALTGYNRFLQLSPNDGAAYNNRGNIYYDRGNYDLARADYDKAISLPYSDKYIAYYNRGNLNYQVGDYKDALSDLTQDVSLNDADANGFLLRASVYQATNDPAQLADILQYITLIKQQTTDENGVDFTKGKTLALEAGSVYTLDISGTNGQELRAAASAGANSPADPLLVLLGSDGKAVAWDDDSGVNLDSVLRYTIPADGTYTLLLAYGAGGDTGDVTLTVSLGDAGGTAAAPDTFRVFDLAVNMAATVFASKGDHLNLRSGPGLSFDVLTQLDRDTPVTLLEGPRKNNGYNWWRVRTGDGTEGWAVERVEDTQTLYAALKVGDQAIVTLATPGDTLRVRQSPGLSGAVVTQLTDGTTVTLTDGPQQADGNSWWKIKMADGTEGWTVESASDERTLIRADAASG